MGSGPQPGERTITLPTPEGAAAARPRLRFDRNELSGAFGDMGTDLPLLVGMILAARLDAASVLIAFGALQVATGVAYRMPMPVQPLKAVATIVITQQVAAPVLFGGGLAIGALMLAISVTGLLGWIGRVVTRPVVRGLQLGLGLQLALLALGSYIPSSGPRGWLLAAIAAAILLALLGNRRWPAALVVVALGAAYALTTTASPGAIGAGLGFALPILHVPRWPDVVTGVLVLALPQLPLSIGNSVLATRQLAQDLFPERPPPGVRRIGVSYALMNLVAPFVSGVPVCHGSGGMAGHFAHGGRTGGSVVLYGSFFLVAGLLFSGSFAELVEVFPRPVLGVLLLVEGVVLVRLLRDLRRDDVGELPLALLVGVLAVGMPYGYLVAMVVGAALSALFARSATNRGSGSE